MYCGSRGGQKNVLPVFYPQADHFLLPVRWSDVAAVACNQKKR
jgi:hypothetical protein